MPPQASGGCWCPLTCGCVILVCLCGRVAASNPPPSLRETLVVGLNSQPDHLEPPPHPEILDLITSAKTLFPNKATFAASKHQDVVVSLCGWPFDPLHAPRPPRPPPMGNMPDPCSSWKKLHLWTLASRILLGWILTPSRTLSSIVNHESNTCHQRHQSHPGHLCGPLPGGSTVQGEVRPSPSEPALTPRTVV